MPAEPVPVSSARTAPNTSSFSSQPSSLPLWDRLSKWASENKTIVYTIAGVAVVIAGTGVVYYGSDSRKSSRELDTDEKKRASKKERRKAKKEKEKGQDTEPQPKAVPEEGE